MDTFVHSRLVICEGAEEFAVVRRMLAVGLLHDLDACVIGDGGGSGRGITGLKRFLEVIPVNAGFTKVQKIGILGDSDESEVGSFAKIAAMITGANNNPDVKRKYGIPTIPFVAATGGDIPITVILSPGGGNPGCLDTIVWNILLRRYPAAAGCVTALVGCAGVSAAPQPWPQQKIDKAKVRAALAVIHRKNPAIALGRLWQDPNDAPFDVTEPELTALAASLGAF